MEAINYSKQPSSNQLVDQNGLIRTVNEVSHQSSTSKRRRVSDPWMSKRYDDKTPCASKIKEDAIEDLGRQHWIHSNSFPIEVRPLCTAKYLGNWCYFPKKMGKWEEIKIRGVAGMHYAIGYKQLGEMIIRYGNDYSSWPTLS